MDETVTTPPAERPLVTFALFAYNQEKYIREAVEGAFSQTYEPLEIILSDDCSSDRTFEIMQEMAAEYKGKHRVLVRQSGHNRGLGLHFSDVINVANGEYVVVAAGDDVSLPFRTNSLVGTMMSENSLLAMSSSNIIDESGNEVAENVSLDNSEHFIWNYVNSSPEYFVNGAAAAYSKIFLVSAFAAISKTLNLGKVNYEDVVFSAYAVAKGFLPSNYSAAPLIKYRVVSTSLSNFDAHGRGYRRELELIKRERFRSSTQLASLQAILEMAESYPDFKGKLNFDRILRDKRRAEVELSACQPGFLHRLRGIFQSASASELRIRGARLFGVWFLVLIRVVFRGVLR